MLNFRRSYIENDNVVKEDGCCYQYLQEHGSAFLLDPNDEKPIYRRNQFGERKQEALFLHGVECIPDEDPKDYFSVAFIFRCLQTEAIVDATTDRVIHGPSKSNHEAEVRMERALLRQQDAKPNSDFSMQVQEVQEEWRRLMRHKGWM